MNRKAPLLGFLAGVVALSGCIHLPPRCERSDPPPVPSALADRFASRGRKITAATETEQEARHSYRLKQIELAVQAEGDTNAHIGLYFYQPKRDRSPVLVLLPMSGGDYAIEHLFARYFVRNGFAVVIAQRREIPHEARLEAIDPWLEDTVRDNRFALDWIETRPELDTSRIALFGISMGGIRGVLLTAVDRRIGAAVLGLAGGDLPYILTHSTERGIVRRREEYMQRHQMTLAELRQQLQETLHSEPNELAAYVDCRRVFLVLAMWDKVVPFRKGWELREKMGRPETLLVPTGHYSAGLGIPGIEQQSLRFFKKRLALEPYLDDWQRLRAPRDPFR